MNHGNLALVPSNSRYTIARSMRRETPPKTRTWYGRVEEGLVARHEERDDDEEAPRENDHPGSKWSLSSTETPPFGLPNCATDPCTTLTFTRVRGCCLFIAHTRQTQKKKRKETKGKERKGTRLLVRKVNEHAFPLFLSCTRRGAPHGRLGFADFSDRLASSELLVFLPRVS